jgi:hypothetical protein
MGSGWSANKNFYESWDVLRAVPEPYHRWGDLVIHRMVFTVSNNQKSYQTSPVYPIAEKMVKPHCPGYMTGSKIILVLHAHPSPNLNGLKNTDDPITGLDQIDQR